MTDYSKKDWFTEYTENQAKIAMVANVPPASPSVAAAQTRIYGMVSTGIDVRTPEQKKADEKNGLR